MEQSKRVYSSTSSPRSTIEEGRQSLPVRDHNLDIFAGMLFLRFQIGIPIIGVLNYIVGRRESERQVSIK